VAVHQGQLSVDVDQADLRTVLAQIDQQAGIAIVLTETAATVVSAQFAGLNLDDGLRQLLWRAAVNYLLMYLTFRTPLASTSIFFRVELLHTGA
jgi:type II secretory pathway component HofQ